MFTSKSVWIIVTSRAFEAQYLSRLGFPRTWKGRRGGRAVNDRSCHNGFLRRYSRVSGLSKGADGQVVFHLASASDRGHMLLLIHTHSGKECRTSVRFRLREALCTGEVGPTISTPADARGE